MRRARLARGGAEGGAGADRSLTGASTMLVAIVATGTGGASLPLSAAHNGRATQSRNAVPAQMLRALRST
jgi:hypothetical protein